MSALKDIVVGFGLVVSSIMFLSTAGRIVSDWAADVIKTNASWLLTPQMRIIVATLGAVGIVYFGSKVIQGSSTVRKVTTAIDSAIPLMVDLPPLNV